MTAVAAIRSWCAAAALAVAASAAQADAIIVIGDSWAEPIGTELRIVLDAEGHADTAVHTTPFRGGPRNLDTDEGRADIAAWLEQWPDANYLYMMMGQNNWLCCWTTDMIGTQEETDLFESIIGHTENVIDHVLSIRPQMKILWTAGEYFRPHHLGTPTQVNAKHDLLAELALAFAEGRPELTFIDWNGHLQVVFGFNGVANTEYDPTQPIPPGDPSLPDPTLPSPVTAFRNAAHPNEGGYRVLAQALYDRYFAAELGGLAFAVNPGLNDAWYNPATDGQGFLVSVYPEVGQMFIAWFTFDTERPGEGVTASLGDPGHRWLTAQGPYDGDTANLTLYATGGGVFDAAEPPASTDPAGIGSLIVEFADCGQALVTYDITAPALTGVIPIERIVPDNMPLCESLADQPVGE
jgi:hypothetical protein